jgi:hypothetical protein
MNHFLYSAATADNDWNLLSENEQEIFGDEDTFKTILRECRIQMKLQ